MMAFDLREAIANRLRFERDVGVGALENAAMLGSGMVAEPFAGIAGLGAGAAEILRGRRKNAGQAARETVEGVRERMTFQPRSDVGQRGAANIGRAVESVAEPLDAYVSGAIGERSPALGAGLLAAANVIGPKGAPRGAKPRFDPGSPQQLIPGVEPISVADALRAHRGRMTQALEDADFIDPDTNLRYDYRRAGTNPSGGRWQVSQERLGENAPEGVKANMAVTGAPHRPGSFDDFMVRDWEPDARESYEQATQRMREQGGHAPAQRLLETRDRLRAMEGEEAELNTLAGREEIAQGTAQLRALRDARVRMPDDASLDAIAEKDAAIYAALRAKPVEGAEGIWRSTDPAGTPIYEAPGGGRVAAAGAEDYPELAQRFEDLDRARAGAVQSRREARDVSEFLRGDEPPAPVAPEWVNRLEAEAPGREGTLMQGRGEDLPASREWWHEKLGVIDPKDPNAMLRGSVSEFLRNAPDNPALFEYGGKLSPAEEIIADRGGREGMARVFSERSGKPIKVREEESYGESDEPYKIEREKEHGSGEVMRDRYGDYKTAEYEAGTHMRKQDTGEKKYETQQAELQGPIQPGAENAYRWAADAPWRLMGEKKKPVLASGGEMKIDESGEPVYAKSEGGEPMRDERGRVKVETLENPDYSESEAGVTGRIEVPGEGYLTYTQPEGEPMSISAMEGSAGGKKGEGGTAGGVMYQTLFADASRQGNQIGVDSLTDANSLRILSNALTNYARMGTNPRDVTRTQSGYAKRAFGYAEGPEIWRAEASEARRRIALHGGDPDKLQFDGGGFVLDGKPVGAKEIYSQLETLSPEFKQSKVGTKTVMRMAFWDWLKSASPEDAKRVAQTWSKDKSGPLFSIAAAVAGGALLSDDNNDNPDGGT
jgi:hypothetical protein